MTDKLTLAENERLAYLIEEMGEAIQAATKILRHGYSSMHPAEPKGANNRRRLELEIGDVVAAIMLMELNGDIIKSEPVRLGAAKCSTIMTGKHPYFLYQGRKNAHT